MPDPAELLIPEVINELGALPPKVNSPFEVTKAVV